MLLEALHHFTAHNITWRALPERYGNWNSVRRRFDRLAKSAVFEGHFAMLAGLSETAHLVQMFDSTVIRAQVSAAGTKGERRTGVRAIMGQDLREKPFRNRSLRLLHRL